MRQISKATEYNWKRLNSDSKIKLTKRANKTQSKKRVVATAYLDYAPAYSLLSELESINAPVGDIIFTLCLHYLRHSGIIEKDNVKKFISTLQNYNEVDIDEPNNVWDIDEDVIGFIYQSLITEGERNITGQYYTSKKIAQYMLDGKILKDGETFLDPCCGSGAFLLVAKPILQNVYMDLI